jgi:hypothetical protein
MGQGSENIDDRKWQIFFWNTSMPQRLRTDGVMRHEK